MAETENTAENRITVLMDRTQLELVEGDITDLDVDAIVNPANDQLQLGTGVAGAIRRKGGPSIQEECNRIGGTPVGTAVLTGAGPRNARGVLHAGGPRRGGGDGAETRAAAGRAALALADRRGVKSIALPAISTGNFGFPIDRAARIMLTEIHRFLQGGTKLERVVVALHGDEAFGVFKRELRRGCR